MNPTPAHPSDPHAGDLAFASGGGEMGAVLRGLDWRASPLGPLAAWPQPLRTAVGIMLGSSQPMYVAWGPQLCLLYNDAYRQMLGARARQPEGLLGQPFRVVWADVWETAEPMLAAALRGEPFQVEDHPFVLMRNGYPEQMYASLSLSGVRDERGAIAGVFCACTETTAKVASQAARDAALVTLEAVVAGAVETSLPLVEAAGQALSVRLPAAPVPLEVDRVRISQVLSNLLSNAAKYTPRGGRIDIEARVEDGQALIVVSDTGIGIADESLPAVFDMFTQVARSIDRSRGGLGIGLALVRHLVQLHGGSVTAASPGPGLGSSFTVRLPLGPAPAVTRGAAAAPAPAVAIRPLRVLVADDNVDAAETLRALLELGGHHVRVAHDGLEAVALAGAMQPELVFLDIGMPRMDGCQAARAIRGLPDLAAVPLVAVTGWGAEDDRQRSREAGFDAHLLKPAMPEQVAAILVRTAAHPEARG